MVKIFIKILIIIAPLLLPVIVLSQDPYAAYNENLTSKIKVLTKHYNYSLIIAGDSRAEWQIIPKVIQEKFQIDSINIGTTSCDVITTFNAMKKQHMLEKPLIVIISAGFHQVNDGAIDLPYMSLAELANMTIGEKLNLYEDNYSNLYITYAREFAKMFQSKFKKEIAKFIDSGEPADVYLNDFGYCRIEGNLPAYKNMQVDPEVTTHPWYRKIRTNGVRLRIFKETLRRMSHENCKFVLYQAPISDAFRNYIKDSKIERSELEFTAMLREEVKNYQNIKFIDYFTIAPKEFVAKDFYDTQHLNRAGAEKFTKLLIQDCIDNNYIITDKNKFIR